MRVFAKRKRLLDEQHPPGAGKSEIGHDPIAAGRSEFEVAVKPEVAGKIPERCVVLNFANSRCFGIDKNLAQRIFVRVNSRSRTEDQTKDVVAVDRRGVRDGNCVVCAHVLDGVAKPVVARQRAAAVVIVVLFPIGCVVRPTSRSISPSLSFVGSHFGCSDPLAAIVYAMDSGRGSARIAAIA